VDAMEPNKDDREHHRDEGSHGADEFHGVAADGLFYFARVARMVRWPAAFLCLLYQASGRMLRDRAQAGWKPDAE